MLAARHDDDDDNPLCGENREEDSEWKHRPPRFFWTMTMLPGPFYNTETPQSKVLAYHQCNSYFTTDSVIPSLHSQLLYKPHPEWIAAAQHRNQLLHHRNSEIVEKYNRHTHNLSPLQTSDTVAIQSPLTRQWNTRGKVITTLPNRHYWIRVDGSGRITLRNRRFQRKCKFMTASSATPAAITPTILHFYILIP